MNVSCAVCYGLNRQHSQEVNGHCRILMLLRALNFKIMVNVNVFTGIKDIFLIEPNVISNLLEQIILVESSMLISLKNTFLFLGGYLP